MKKYGAIFGLASILSTSVGYADQACTVQLNTGLLVLKQSGSVGNTVSIKLFDLHAGPKKRQTNIGGEHFETEYIDEIRITGASLEMVKRDQDFLLSIATDKSFDDNKAPTMTDEEIKNAVKQIDCSN